MAKVQHHRHSSPPLLGRERELGVLTASLSVVLTGSGQLVLISGEPGIGKTRLAEEAAADAADRDVRTFWGRCFEWAGTPAYWPWIEVLRDLIESSDLERLPMQLGQDVSLIAQVVPQIANMLPDLPPAPSMNPEQARFRLFDGITRYLKQMASEQPLLVILDDLHWADPGSLLLLEFVARELGEMPLFIIGTYRDVEVRRDHPLASTLASLVRVRATQRLSLGGLTRDHVGELIRQMAGIEPREQAIDDVHAETEGNPFFATEVVRLLVEQRYFEGAESTGNWNVAIPESVREAIGRGLDRLSERCNEMLRVASVIGREFDLAILQSVSELEFDALLATLDEAIEARVLREQAHVGRYHFTHTLIQETLYEELSSSRRFRLHGEVGEALEHEHHRNLAPHYGDLARHFRLSPFGENLDKAISYAIQAGDQAIEQVAWESAAGHFQRAVELLEAHRDVDPIRLCETLLKLAEAQGRAGVSRGQALGAGVDPVSRDTFMRVARIAQKENLHELRARAALSIAGLNPWANVSVEEIRLMYDALCALPEEDSDVRARLLSRLSRVIYLHTVLYGTDSVDGVPSFEDSLRWSAQAIEMARRLDDPAALSHALLMRPVTFTGPVEEIDEHLLITEELLHAASRADDQVTLFWGHAVKNCFLLQRGDIEASNQVVEGISSLGESLKLPLIDWILAMGRAGKALRTGQYDEADVFIERANQLWPNSFVTNCQRFILQREQGQASEASEGIVGSSSVPRMVRFPFALVHSLETSRPNEARVRLRGAELRGFLRQPKTPSWIRGLTLISEVCAELDDSEPASLVYEALNPFGYQNHNCEGVDDKGGGCISHYLGLLATTLERWDDAEQHFAVSLELNQRWGFSPYVAHTRYACADMLLRRGEASDRERAREFLTLAKATAQEFGMVRLLRKISELERRSGLRTRVETAGLSPREVEVLRLLVDSKTDKEIADRLFISPRTVMHHVSNILRKLDVDSRGAAAVHAVRNDLV